VTCLIEETRDGFTFRTNTHRNGCVTITLYREGRHFLAVLMSLQPWPGYLVQIAQEP
jgi:hypothetical protein